jgi:hypothetical protein
MSACTADDNDCCYKSFGAGSIIIPMDRCHQQAPNPQSAPATSDDPFCVEPRGSRGDAGMFHAYGLIYRLMQNDVPVYWLVNPTKSAPAVTATDYIHTDRDVDFWVLSSSATGVPTWGKSPTSCTGVCRPPVIHLNSDLTDETGSYPYMEFPSRGGSFIIDASDRTKFDALYTTTGAFAGYSSDTNYDFSAVDLYEIQTGAKLAYLDYRTTGPNYTLFNGGGNGPVAVTLDYEAPRLAREDPGNVSATWLALAKLGDPAAYPACRTGDWSPSTAVYCDLLENDIEAGYLQTGGFDWAWMDRWNAAGGNCSSQSAQTINQQLSEFLTAVPGMKDGQSVMLMGSPISITEQCSGKELFGATGGLGTTNAVPGEPYIIRYPSNLFMQVADLQLAFAVGSSVNQWEYTTNGYGPAATLVRLAGEDTGTLCKYHRANLKCDSYPGDQGDMASYARYQDDLNNGVLFYMAGNQITQGGNMSHLRMVLNSFLALPNGNQDSNASTSTSVEVTRSSPIVGDAGDGIDALYQGSISVMTPAVAVTRYTGTASDSTFRFPHFTGHFRGIDTDKITDSDQDFATLAAVSDALLFDAADGIPATKPAGCGADEYSAACRTIFTTTTTGDNTSKSNRPSQVALSTTNAAITSNGLAALLNSVYTDETGSTFSSTELNTLISRVHAGQYDTGTSTWYAALGGVDRSTAAVIPQSPILGVTRPTMAYFGATDGMIHAVCVDTVGKCTSKGQELWAFMPRQNLPLLFKNHQRVDGSITVDDVYGDFDSDGTAEYKTILTFQVGNNAHEVGDNNVEPGFYALDVTDPTAPVVLWEAAAGHSNTYDIGIGLETAMGIVNISSVFKSVTFAQTSNGGNGGSGFRIEARDTVTGAFIWANGGLYEQPRRNTVGDPLELENDAAQLPATAIPGGVSGFDEKGTGFVTHLVAPSVRGELFVFDADDGVEPMGAGKALFSFSDDYRPIGARPAIMRIKGSNKFAAVVGSGGYTDPGKSLTWSPDNDPDGAPVVQWVVGVPLDSIGSTSPTMSETGTSSVAAFGGFAYDLTAGERVFAPVTVAGNSFFFSTDTDNVNAADYGLGAASGKLYQGNMKAAATGTASSLDSVKELGKAVAGGAGAVAVNADGRAVISGAGGVSKQDAQDGYDATGGDLVTGELSITYRQLWLRLR